MFGATTSKQYILTEDYLAEGALYLEVGSAAFKVFIHLYIYIYMRVYIYMYMYIYTYMYTCIYIRILLMFF